MKRVKNLEKALKELFCSGATEEHDAEEMMALLEGMDYHALLQALYSMRETVHEYRVDSKLEKSFNYRAPSLFPTKAVLLYEDPCTCCYDVALFEHAYELWLLPDTTFVVVSRVRTEIDGGTSVAEYRTIKGTNWRDTEMDIDFLDFADSLETLCSAVRKRELPMYEL